jgi:threonine/homoserine/homoserine lactone efflux protein
VIPVWGFVAVAVPLVLTPGASTAIVLRNSLSGGVRAGLVTAVGINTGSFCYGLLTAFGFAVALQRWPYAWTLLRAGGTIYLGWLALQSLRHAASPRAFAGAGPEPRIARPAWLNLYEGFVTNALNPAIATFYLVLLPQFIPRGAPFARSALALTALHIALAGSWHVLWAVAGATLARTIGGGRPRQVLEALTGIALLGLAIVIAIG